MAAAVLFFFFWMLFASQAGAMLWVMLLDSLSDMHAQGGGVYVSPHNATHVILQQQQHVQALAHVHNMSHNEYFAHVYNESSKDLLGAKSFEQHAAILRYWIVFYLFSLSMRISYDLMVWLLRHALPRRLQRVIVRVTGSGVATQRQRFYAEMAWLN